MEGHKDTSTLFIHHYNLLYLYHHHYHFDVIISRIWKPLSMASCFRLDNLPYVVMINIHVHIPKRILTNDFLLSIFARHLSVVHSTTHKSLHPPPPIFPPFELFFLFLSLVNKAPGAILLYVVIYFTFIKLRYHEWAQTPASRWCIILSPWKITPPPSDTGIVLLRKNDEY